MKSSSPEDLMRRFQLSWPVQHDQNRNFIRQYRQIKQLILQHHILKTDKTPAQPKNKLTIS